MLSLTTLRSAAMAAMIAGGSAGLAQAADILHAPAPPPLAPPPSLDVGSGFYLRGDIGVGIPVNQDVRNQPALAGFRTLTSDVENTFFFGIGAGYAFNSWLRTDATIEYRKNQKFKVVEEGDNGTPGVPADDGINITSGKVRAIVGLLNAYVDLGTWHRVTPFLGVGVGFAHLDINGVNDQGFAGFGGTGAASDRTKTNFAWAIHAGLGYDVTSNWKAELGYRYLNMGKINSANIVCTPACAGPFNVGVKRLDSHDIKFGLRYMFAEAPPAFLPGPLVRKY